MSASEGHDITQETTTPADQDDTAGKLFVGGLSWQTTEDGLRLYFDKFGELVDVALMTDKRTGQPRGFGFVSFKDPAAIDVVLGQSHSIDGRVVDVKRAVPRDEAPAPSRQESRKVFVGGLPPEVGDKEFSEYFSKYGALQDSIVMYDRKTNRSRGFGFVTFQNETDVAAVLRKDHHEIMGKWVELKRAEPRESRDMGMGGRGDGRGMGYGGRGPRGGGGQGGYDDGYGGQYGGGYMGGMHMGGGGRGGSGAAFGYGRGSGGYGGGDGGRGGYGYGGGGGYGYGQQGMYPYNGGYSNYSGGPAGGGYGGPGAGRGDEGGYGGQPGQDYGRGGYGGAPGGPMRGSGVDPNMPQGGSQGMYNLYGGAAGGMGGYGMGGMGGYPTQQPQQTQVGGAGGVSSPGGGAAGGARGMSGVQDMSGGGYNSGGDAAAGGYGGYRAQSNGSSAQQGRVDRSYRPY